MKSDHTHRRFRLPFGVRVDWHRYVHHYHDGDRRYVNQWHAIRDVRNRIAVRDREGS